MALINNFALDREDLTDETLEKFLHLRTREWKITQDPSGDPTKLDRLPDNYLGASSAPETGKPTKWYHKPLEPAASQEPPAQGDPNYNWNPPTFSPVFHGGETDVPECIMTQPAVQNAILDFFDEVAKDPTMYCNPTFEAASVPHPTADNPQSFFARRDPDAIDVVTDDPALLTPEQEAIDDAKAVLAGMKRALRFTPTTTLDLQASSERLAERIAQREREIVDMERGVLAVGGLAAGEGQQAREEVEEWAPEPEAKGPEIPFAGVKVDSELVKSVGCVDTVRDELAKLGLDAE